MKKTFWLILTCILVGLISGPLYFWYQATRLPDWYSDRAVAASSLDLSDRAAIQQAAQKVEARLSNIQPAPDGRAEVELNEAELNALVASQVARIADSQNLAPVVKRINTQIAEGRIESGAVINLADLPARSLRQHEQDLLMQLVQAFPGLSDRDVYVGIEGTPAIADGRLKLDGTHLWIGNVRFSVADVARQLGVSESALRECIGQQLPLDQLGIWDVQLEDASIKIQGVVE